MAKEIVVFDLNNPSSAAKIVYVDIGTLIRTGSGGEEEWLIKFYTQEYSNNITLDNIRSLYLDELSSGWYKSSGLVDSYYTMGTNCDSLNIKIDGSQGTYPIVLDHGNSLTGKVVAKDIENKIKEIPETGEWLDNDSSLSFGYTNCRVNYIDSKFYVLSGSSGNYSGDKKSSVSIEKVTSNTAYEVLGFSLGVNSEDLDSTIITESLLVSNYNSDTEDLIVGNNITPQDGEAFYITDGINEDYFVCISGSVTGNLKVQTYSVNSYIGIKHNYLSGQSKVQIVKDTDPDFAPPNYTTSLDDMIKWGIASISNKIDYTAYGV